MGSSAYSFFIDATLVGIFLAVVTLVSLGVRALPATDNYWWDPQYEIDVGDGTEYPRVMEFSPAGDSLAFFAGNLTVLDTVTRETVLEWQPPREINPTSMCWSNDGRWIAWRPLDEVQVFSVETVEVVEELAFGEKAGFFSFSPGDDMLGVLSEHYLYVVNTTTWNLTREIPVPDTDASTVYSFAWHPSGDSLVVFGDFHGYLYDVSTWELLGTLESFQPGKRGVWTGDGRLIHSTTTAIMEYDLENETDTHLVSSLRYGYIIPIYDGLSDDIIICEQYYLPRVFDRARLRYVQQLDMSGYFSSATTGRYVSLSSSNMVLAVRWTEDYATEHLTILFKRDVSSAPSLSLRPETAFAMLRAYDVGFSIGPLIAPDSIRDVRLDVGGHSGVVWSVDDGSMSASNPLLVLDGVTLSTGQASALVFTVWFNWSFPDVDGCDLALDLGLTEGRNLSWEFDGAFDVVSSLETSGPFLAEGEFQGPLVDDGWTRAGEAVNWTMPNVSYAGHPGVFPPPHHVVWFLYRNGSLVWSGNPGTDRATRTTIAMPDVALGSYHFASVATTAHDNGTIGERTFDLRVDGTPPDYTEHIPEQGVWQATTDVQVGARVTDGSGSGPDPGSLVVAWRTGVGGWSVWTGVTVDTIDGGAIFGSILTEMREGEENWVRWRCTDRVGNENATAPLAVLVDLTHVRFSDLAPTDWTNTTSVQCSVSISDLGGSGVLGPSVRFRWSTRGLSGYGPWTWMDLQGSQQLWSVLTTVQFLEDGDNYIQWRAEDVAGTGLTDSEHHRVRIDTSPPTFGVFTPASIQTGHDVPLSIEVFDNGSGVQTPDRMEWRLDDGSWSWVDSLSGGVAGVNASFDRDGRFNVTFRARDGAGNTAVSRTFVVAVDTTPPVISIVRPAPGSFIVGTRCTVEVSVRDDVSGVNASSLMFSLRRGAGSDWSPWQRTTVTDWDDGAVEASTEVELDLDHDNWIRFRVTDAAGNGPAVTTDLQLPVDLPPTALMSSPDPDDAFSDGTPVLFDSAGSGDAEGEVTVRWVIDGGWHETSDRSFTLQLPAGAHNVTLVVVDEAGQATETSVVLNVLATEEEAWSGHWLIVLVVVAALVISSVVLVRLRAGS